MDESASAPGAPDIGRAEAQTMSHAGRMYQAIMEERISAPSGAVARGTAPARRRRRQVVDSSFDSAHRFEERWSTEARGVIATLFWWCCEIVARGVRLLDMPGEDRDTDTYV